MANANDETVNETDAFEAVTSEAVVPDDDAESTGDNVQAQEPQGEESASAQEQDTAQDGDENGKDAGKDDADNKPAADASEERKPKGRRYQKRIDRLTKRAAEAERRAQELERQLQGGKGKQTEDGATPGEEPDPANFDDYDEYLDALTDWKAGKAPADRQSPKQDKGKQGDQAAGDDTPAAEDDPDYREALEDVQEAFSDSRSAYEDFDEVIGQQDLQITRDMVKAMADTDDPGGIAYHLGKHKDEASRIAALSPVAQAKEIGKLEAMLAAKPQQPGKKTTQAPDPIEPVRGTDSTTTSPQNMSFDEYEKHMNEKEQRRGGGFW